MFDRMPPLLRARIEELKGTPQEISSETLRRALVGQALFDRVLVWQVPPPWYGGKTFGDTGIFKPETTIQRHYESTPRGLLISMGLGAIDSLRSNGVDIGHYVTFAAMSPYREPLDDTDQEQLMVVRAGDLIKSEDLARALDSGECRVELVNGVSTLIDSGGKNWKPRLPWMEE